MMIIIHLIRTFYYFATVEEQRNSWKIAAFRGEFSKFASLHELDLYIWAK